MYREDMAANILKEAEIIVRKDLSRRHGLLFPVRAKFQDTEGYRKLLKQVQYWLDTGKVLDYHDIWWMNGYDEKPEVITNQVISSTYDTICPSPFISFLPNGRSLWTRQKQRCIAASEDRVLLLNSRLRGVRASYKAQAAGGQ